MVFWQHIPPAPRARLTELSDLFLDCRSAFFETAAQFHWTPTPRSAAASAAEDLPSPDPAIVTPHGETGHRLIAEVVQTYLLTASGHLGGLASLYRDGEVFFPPAVLVRAVIENCAHAMWVLGDDPDEAPETRLARAYLEEVVSAEESKKTAGRLGSKTGSTYIRENRRYRELKAEVLARFPATTPTDLGSYLLEGQQWPRPEACVEWMYAFMERSGGSTIDRRGALGVYGFLSNMTHPTLYPARQLREWTPDPTHGHPVAYLKLDVDFLERQASAAVAAFYQTLSYATSYFGWDTSVHDALTSKIDAKMPDYFV